MRLSIGADATDARQAEHSHLAIKIIDLLFSGKLEIRAKLEIVVN